MTRLTLLIIVTFLFGADLLSQGGSQSYVDEIQNRIDQLRTAHLENNTQLAQQIYHEDLVLVSQSGKKYGKEDAIRNIQNKFDSYDNDEIEWLSISDDVVLTTFVNKRKFADFPKGQFRLVAIWKKEKNDWQLISLQSSRMKKR